MILIAGSTKLLENGNVNLNYIAMAKKCMSCGGSMGKKSKMQKGGAFPDLTGDGKVTKADVLKGRGVFKKGGTVKKKK